MENKTVAVNEKAIEAVFEEMRREKAAANSNKSKGDGSFKPLPDGNYTGQVYILTNTVGNEASPNYGLKKYEFQYRVTEGEFKGKMAYFHYVIIPHHLATPPPATDENRSKKWVAAVKLCLEDADTRLRLCGVDTSDFDPVRLIQRIAENNRRKPVVNFTMRDGTPHPNFLVKEIPVEDQSDSLFTTASPPDGNDAPL